MTEGADEKGFLEKAKETAEAFTPGNLRAAYGERAVIPTGAGQQAERG